VFSLLLNLVIYFVFVFTVDGKNLQRYEDDKVSRVSAFTLALSVRITHSCKI